MALYEDLSVSCYPITIPSSQPECKGNRPLEPRALEVEFFPLEEVLHAKVKIH
jgi:hypothetical protein